MESGGLNQSLLFQDDHQKAKQWALTPKNIVDSVLGHHWVLDIPISAFACPISTENKLKTTVFKKWVEVHHNRPDS